MKLLEKTPKELRCIIGQCPAIFETNRNTYIIIGTLLSKKQTTELLNGRIGKNEVAIELPKKLLKNINSKNL